MKKSPWLLGALVGLMLTAPLGALFFLFSQLFKLALVPFDLFEWISKLQFLGPLIIQGIEIMKNMLVVVGLSVKDYAKTTEQLMAILLFLVVGVVAVAAYFETMSRSSSGSGGRSGLVLGAVVGVPLMIIVAVVDINSQALQTVNAVYTLGAFLAWGAAAQWFQTRLAEKPVAAKSAAAEGDAKPEPLTLEQLDRRRFLVRAGAATAAITVVGAGLSSVLASSTSQAGSSQVAGSSGPKLTPTPIPTRPPLPNMDAELQPAPGTRPEYTPLDQHYRIDINLQYPEIDGTSYALPIDGLVNKQLKLTLDDIKKYPSMDQYITLACISNNVGGDLIGTTRWTGVSLQKILADADLMPDAKYLYIEASDGFFESVPIDVVMSDERVMLCYAWDGQTLPEEHGFPLRIYIPNHYGMKQPKWITHIEATAQEKLGYWVVRGWDHDAIMKATSVVDTVAVANVYEKNGQKLIPVGGIAHAGSRSVSKVQVKVDNGAWVDAQLRKPLSDLTWVIWRYDWPMQTGEHVFSVRCVDGDGVPQIETPADVLPSGATGIDSVQATI